MAPQLESTKVEDGLRQDMTQRLVKDINPNGSSSPNELIEIGGLLYFVAETGLSKDDSAVNKTSDAEEEEAETNDESSTNSGVGLWKTDGSEGGTRLLRAFDGISNLVEANGILYFIGQTDESYELWSSDGTSSGTIKVDTLYPGSNNFAAYNLFAVNDTLFSAQVVRRQQQRLRLWRWEGDDVEAKLFESRPTSIYQNQSIKSMKDF